MYRSSSNRGRNRYASLSGPIKILRRIVDLLPNRACDFVWGSLQYSGSLFSRAVREAILRKQCFECGDLVDIRQTVVFLARRNARIGSRVSIHPFSYIDATGGLIIGTDVSIAHAVTIMSTEHRFDRSDIPIRDQGTIEKPVVIESDVWIGAGARILGGVTIGQGAVVAAGAVVNRDVLRRSIVAGVPARPVRSR